MYNDKKNIANGVIIKYMIVAIKPKSFGAFAGKYANLS